MGPFLGDGSMPPDKDVQVYLLPGLAPTGRLTGGLAVVIDVLRATTTMIHALAAGCTDVRPCAEVDEARRLADSMRAGRVLLGGERDGRPLPGFDLGNSPREYTCQVCRGRTVVLTTTNGTRALLRGAEAERTFVAGFVNYSAVCEQLRQDARPIHIVCAGTDGAVTLEDTLLAGALVDFLSEAGDVRLNDSARLAWDCFENHGRVLLGALEVSHGGANLRQLGYDDDIRAAAQVDVFHLVPELRRDPLRVEVGAVGIVKSHWIK
jgi:2-phosphosulfolactate phosphatase